MARRRFIFDDGDASRQVRERWPKGYDKVLELVGMTTIEDSARCAREGGRVCVTGVVGGFGGSKMSSLPKGVEVTNYAGEAPDFNATTLMELAEQVANGNLHVQIGRVFHIDEIVEAHRVMEHNEAGGKIVVLTDNENL